MKKDVTTVKDVKEKINQKEAPRSIESLLEDGLKFMEEAESLIEEKIKEQELAFQQSKLEAGAVLINELTMNKYCVIHPVDEEVLLINIKTDQEVYYPTSFVLKYMNFIRKEITSPSEEQIKDIFRLGEIAFGNPLKKENSEEKRNLNQLYVAFRKKTESNISFEELIQIESKAFYDSNKGCSLEKFISKKYKL